MAQKRPELMSATEPPHIPGTCEDTRFGRRSVLLRGVAGTGFAVGATMLTSCDAAGPQAPVPGSTGTGIRLVALGQLVAGQPMVATSPAGEPVVLVRTGDAVVVAHSGVCTHQGCTVAPSGATVRCPCHGSIFNAATGEVITGPAQTPLPAIAVRVVQDQVVTA